MISRVPGSFSASEDFNDARMVVFLRPWEEREEKTQERSEEHTSELQSLMRISYAVFCLKKKITTNKPHQKTQTHSNHIHSLRHIHSLIYTKSKWTLQR